MYTSQPPSEHRAKTAKGTAVLRSHSLGPHPIIHFFLKRMNLHSIVTSCLGTGSRGDGLLSHAEALEVLVHNLATSPAPLYRLSEWVESIDPASFGVTQAQKKAVNDDRIARTLDKLATEKGRSLFFLLALRVLKEFSLATERIHFDTTTITFYGDYAASVSEPAIRRGHNKEHRPDLKQLLFGLNVTSDGAVPLHHSVWSGNRTDDSVHRGNVAALRRLLGREDFIYVADSKLCTVENLRKIAGAGGKFVTVLPRSRKEDKEFREYLRQEGVRWRFLVKIPSRGRYLAPPDVFSTCKAPENTTKDGYRLIWIRSSQKAAVDKAHREELLEKASAELGEVAEKLNQGRLKTESKIRRKVASILKVYKVSQFIEVKVRWKTEIKPPLRWGGRPRRGRPQKKIRNRVYYLEISNKKGCLKAEARTDGVFSIVTNLPASTGKREVLLMYKYQPYLEKRFSSLKSELVVAPVFLKKPLRVVGMLHAYYIAIMLYSLIERTVRLNMKRRGIRHLPLLPEKRDTNTPTAPRIFEAFSGAVWFELEQAGDLTKFPLHLNNTQNLLLSLLEVPEDVYT